MLCSEDESPQPGTEVPLAPTRYLHCYPRVLTCSPPGLPSPAAFRLPCRSWRWPRPRQAACWWSCPSCGCCRCAARWPCAPCRPTASRPTPFQLPSPRPWWQPARQPRSPAPHHDRAPRPDLPLLQPPQGLETPALPSGALTPVEHESPPEAPLPERHQKDPTRSPRHLALRYSAEGEGDRRRLGERPRAWALPHCLPFQEEAGAAVLGASEDVRASEPSAAERAPDPAASPLAKEEALPAPCSAQGALGQQVPCAEGCRGGDPGSGLRPRAEVRGWGHTGPSHRIGAASLPLPA